MHELPILMNDKLHTYFYSLACVRKVSRLELAYANPVTGIKSLFILIISQMNGFNLSDNFMSLNRVSYS